VQYLTKEQILLIHSMVIDETGGSHGVRDLGAILSLEALPQQSFSGKELYPTLFQKAAVYAYGIIFNHPFVDGNKRCAMTSAAVFLENNGYKVVADEGIIEEFALRIIQDKLDRDAVATWYKQHAKKI